MLQLKSIMTIGVITVKADTPIYEALFLLAKNKISGIPVVDDEEQVVGVLSEKDVLKILFDKKLVVDSSVDDYMSRDVICFKEEDSAVDVCKFFIRSNIRRVPIVRDSKIVGIVSRADIIPLLLEAKDKISNLRYI